MTKGSDGPPGAASLDRTLVREAGRRRGALRLLVLLSLVPVVLAGAFLALGRTDAEFVRATAKAEATAQVMSVRREVEELAPTVARLDRLAERGSPFESPPGALPGASRSDLEQLATRLDEATGGLEERLQAVEASVRRVEDDQQPRPDPKLVEAVQKLQARVTALEHHDAAPQGGDQKLRAAVDALSGRLGQLESRMGQVEAALAEASQGHQKPIPR